jgi:hypothetical protein
VVNKPSSMSFPPQTLERGQNGKPSK